MNKSQWRKFYLELYRKKTPNQDEIRTLYEIRKNLYVFFKNKRVKNLMIYHPFRTELPVRKLFDGFDFSFYYPEVKGEHLIVVSEEGKITPVHKMDFIIVPGLFVNPDGYRLGRGKGYYDRFLAKFPRYKTLFLGRSWQVTDGFPIDSWDKKVGFYITEKYISHCL